MNNRHYKKCAKDIIIRPMSRKLKNVHVYSTRRFDNAEIIFCIGTLLCFVLLYIRILKRGCNELALLCTGMKYLNTFPKKQSHEFWYSRRRQQC